MEIFLGNWWLEAAMFVAFAILAGVWVPFFRDDLLAICEDMQAGQQETDWCQMIFGNGNAAIDDMRITRARRRLRFAKSGTIIFSIAAAACTVAPFIH